MFCFVLFSFVLFCLVLFYFLKRLNNQHSTTEVVPTEHLNGFVIASLLPPLSTTPDLKLQHQPGGH